MTDNLTRMLDTEILDILGPKIRHSCRPPTGDARRRRRASADPTGKGRHYSGLAGLLGSAVIFGCGWSGKASFIKARLAVADWVADLAEDARKSRLPWRATRRSASMRNGRRRVATTADDRTLRVSS
jgi:hypothetical protein